MASASAKPPSTPNASNRKSNSPGFLRDECLSSIKVNKVEPERSGPATNTSEEGRGERIEAGLVPSGLSVALALWLSGLGRTFIDLC
jgi:hypothetical protein